ncbi:MAG: sensor histidine kinase [Deltaproteobacteria bacterium]|nr:MAG: sensor histidine kinase [Deltaproteobacteria bacterium]
MVRDRLEYVMDHASADRLPPDSSPAWPQPFDTWAALAHPRRALPILLVATPLIYGQSVWAAQPLGGAMSGLLLASGAALIAPPLWRLFTRWWWGPLPYALLGTGLTWMIAIGLPRLGAFADPFLAQPAAFAILTAATLVAGFLLGRDIDTERHLESKRRHLDALAQARDNAELLALRAQLDPHFLFNTLNAIAEWCATDPRVAERAILALSDVLRTVQRGARQTAWTLREELDLGRAVLDLHAIRDPERFASSLRGEAPDLRVPPLILLPLLENAVKHGPGAGHEGSIEIEVRPLDHGAVIEVSNPGPYAGRREGGQGLELVERRLALLGSGSSRLAMRGAEGRTYATLTLEESP